MKISVRFGRRLRPRSKNGLPFEIRDKARGGGTDAAFDGQRPKGGVLESFGLRGFGAHSNNREYIPRSIRSFLVSTWRRTSSRMSALVRSVVSANASEPMGRIAQAASFDSQVETQPLLRFGRLPLERKYPSTANAQPSKNPIQWVVRSTTTDSCPWSFSLPS